MPATFRITTHGCKLNLADSAEAAERLRAQGLRPAAAGEEAQVVVVNTCTVTHRADADGRQALLRARRQNPGALIIATGCFAERDPAAVGAVPGVDLVLRRLERPALGVRTAAALGLPELQLSSAEGTAPSCLGQERGDDHTRAFLKVQEGCDLACAYCVIPQVRGRSRSVPPAVVDARVRSLIAAGYQEIVLTGVNSGDYGRDLVPRTDLAALLRRLLRAPGLGRLRLNSLEPRTVTAEIVALLAGEQRLAPHLQVPLQSGSDAVLLRMRRNYRAADYAALLERLASRVHGIGLGADVLVGHPGEGDTEFAATEALIAASPLSYLHVFSYSSRPGTAAEAQGGRVAGSEIRARAARLREMGERLQQRFQERCIGRTLQVLGLRAVRQDGRVPALAGNFLSLALEAGETARNRLLAARLVRREGTEMIAIPAH
jgi:threonylcarbamoyladenosine tRNA methylthiotransferase MtaB